MLKPKNILITGITGTLGHAFAALLHDTYECYRVSGIDHNEERVATFRAHHPNIEVGCGDFSEVDLAGYDVVIHLAAMKHIDLCEINAASCISNNVIRTHKLFLNARDNGTDILFMSTDKAVEPTSMYGFSKALMEGMVRELGGAFARSGNILASTGSVLTVWDEAIKNMQPIKITHPDMHRFFITPENLADRVWTQYLAGVKEITPAMDKDCLLVDLAAERLAAHGYTLDSYPPGIEYIGLRPGEKLREKLAWGTEV